MYPSSGFPGSAPHQHRWTSRAARRIGAFLTIFGLVAIAVAGSAAADPATTDDPAAQRAKAQERKQQIEGQLGTLEATDAELQGELAKLDARVAEQDKKAAAARTGRDAALVELERLRGEVDVASHQLDEWKALAAERAVATYMRPDRETASSMLAADDPQELGRMHVLVSEVGHFDADVMAKRADADHALRDKQEQARAVQERADGLAREADEDLAEATTLRDRRAAVHAELQSRMGDLKSEAEALNAQEGRLTALIQQRAAQASTTTTAAPTTTTTAPTTTSTTGRPGAPSTAAPPATAPPTTKAPTTTAAPRGRISLSWPVGGTVTSPFGPRWGTFHKGLDIAASQGTPIHAAADGVVFFSGEMSGYGNVILIDHGNGVVTLYGHQSQLIAGNGARVGRGQTIGLVGSTGHSTGPHVHFEVRVDGVAVDPMSYLG